MLATFTFPDGSIYRASTNPLNTAQGGYQYGGNNYDARIMAQRLNPIQGMSEQGIDILPQVSITLADPDKTLWLNYETASGKGFRGAQLALTFIFWDADTTTFSNDSLVPFIGICGKPTCDEISLEITAVSKFNLQRRFLPPVPIQRRCPWVFPATLAQRQDGADNSDSIYYRCGYSPDASGGNARGNYVSGVTAYTECDFTVTACQARGMYKTDSLTRITGRFGGVTWDPGPGGRSREYTSGNWLDIPNNPNSAKYGDYFPMVYGTAVVDAVVTNIVGDGNSTRGEAVVSLGKMNSILRVVVNDRVLPAATDVTGGTNFNVADALFRYNVVNQGTRQGGPNADIPYNGNGDPYGSLGTILWVVPRSVAETSGAPRVQVLVQSGAEVRQYSSTVSFTAGYTSNPIWIMMDLLVWSGLDYSDFDIQTWIDAAAVCDASISYVDAYGSTSSHARYSCSLVIRQRRSAADAIRGLRQGCNAILSFNFTTGKLQVFIKRTLADQQSSAPDGTNYATGITSKNAAGSTATGYVAYDFGPGSIARSDRGDDSTFQVVSRDNNDAPNVVSFTFVNSENDYSGDSLKMVESTDINRMGGQETAENLRVDGLNTYDQAKRISNAYLAEGLRGNAVGDTRGTEYYRFETSFRAVKLRPGQIIRLSEPQHQLSNVLCRILSVTPTTNWERCSLLVARHSDDWYTNAWGQTNDPGLTMNGKPRNERAPYAWLPGGDPAKWLVSYEPYSQNDSNLLLDEGHETAADGTGLVRLRVVGQCPPNVFSDIGAPIVGQQGTTASSGGTVKGLRVWYMAVCAKDSDGLLSAPSRLCQIPVTAATSLNTITVPVLSWSPGTVGYAVFAGENPNRMGFQANASGTPSSITLAGIIPSFYGLPDQEFDKVRIKVKRILNSGVFYGTVQAVTSSTITITGAAFTTNMWVGYNLSLLHQDAPVSFIPLINYAISGNDADTLSILTLDPSDILVTGDVVVMRTFVSAGSDGTGNYIEDPGWVNNLHNGGAGLDPSVLKGAYLRNIGVSGYGELYKIIENTSTKIYIEGEWITTPDSSSRFIVEEPNWNLIVDSDSLTNSHPGDEPEASIDQRIEVTNWGGQIIGIQGILLDGDGNESLSSQSPYRDLYIAGTGGSIADSGGYQQVGGATTIDVELANGFTAELTLDRASSTINFPTLNGGAPTVGLNFTVKLLQDSTGGREITWDANYIDVDRYKISTDPDTFSAFPFVIRPDGKAELTGLPVIGSANA